MADSIINIIQKARFKVVALDGKTPVTGLGDGDFTKNLFNPDGDEIQGSGVGEIPVTITELSKGYYEADWTMDELGDWDIEVINTTYFPAGKRGSFVVRSAEFALDGEYDTVLTDIQTDITELMGLNFKNGALSDHVYEVYEGQNLLTYVKLTTDTDVYIITATYINGQQNFYQMVPE